MSDGGAGQGLAGLKVVVTGASRGIGLAVSRRLAAAGARVAMVARSENVLRREAAAIGGDPIVADVTSPADVARLAEGVRNLFDGPPDAVVNAAGAFTLAPFAETDPDAFELQLAVNLRGPFLVTRAFLPGMLAAGRGHVVDIGSVAGRIPLPGNAGYAASKYGLRGMHEVLAAELRDTGVRVTLVEPAATDTPMWDPLDPDSHPDLPARARMLTADDVAGAVLFALGQPEGVEVSHIAIRAAR